MSDLNFHKVNSPSKQKSLGKTLFYILYQVLILLLLPFLLLWLSSSLIIHPAYRKDVAQRFGLYPADFFKALRGKRVLWIHAASVGEVMMSRLFMKSLRARYPDAALVFSTSTPSGRAAAQSHLQGIDTFIYLPYDLAWITRSVVGRISPDLFIFMETEIWANLLRSLSKKQIPSMMLNGRISAKSFPRYKRISAFLSYIFEEVSLFLMQTEESTGRLIELGADPDRVETSGNMKYDQAATAERGVRQASLTLAILGLSQSDRLMIAGSTHPGEEAAVLKAYAKIVSDIPSVTLLIAPRHLNRLDEVEGLIANMGFKSIRKSKIAGRKSKIVGRKSNISGSPPPGSNGKKPVILLDTLGELARIYPLGELIFVGGSLAPIGGHNLLEPASFKKPVFFGPHMTNSREIATQLKQSGGGIEVSDAEDLSAKMHELAGDKAAYQKRGEAAYLVVVNNQGAVKRNLDRISAVFERSVSQGMKS